MVSESPYECTTTLLNVKFWPDCVDRSMLIALIGSLKPIDIFYGSITST
jgi:hypothetical protein